MNIFVSSFDPIESAQFLDDKRVVKMCLESAQILSTVMNENGLNGPYKTTHKNHPIVKWVKESSENYWWLIEHFSALCDEYNLRFNKEHKCNQHYDTFVDGYFMLIQDNNF